MNTTTDMPSPEAIHAADNILSYIDHTPSDHLASHNIRDHKPAMARMVQAAIDRAARPADSADTRLRDACSEFRNCVLNGRHQLEAQCLDNDQTNAVLALFDDLIATAPASADPPAPQGETWRMLEVGETIQEGDEWQGFDVTRWHLATELIGLPVLAGKIPRYRRRATPSASAAETPRTDGQISTITGDSGNVYVMANFARTLERELTALHASRERDKEEIEGLKADRDGWSDSFHLLESQKDEQITQLRADLTASQARERAAVAEVERLKTELLRRKD